VSKFEKGDIVKLNTTLYLVREVLLIKKLLLTANVHTGKSNIFKFKEVDQHWKKLK